MSVERPGPRTCTNGTRKRGKTGDQWHAKSDKRGEGDRVRSRVVGVHYVGPPGADQPPQAGSSGEVPLSPHSKPACGKSSAAQPPDEGGVVLRDDERFIAPRALSPGEQEHLPLSAAPIAATIDVQ